MQKFELETFDRDRAKPYSVSFYLGAKLMRDFKRQLTNVEIEKHKKDAFIKDGEVCFGQMVQYFRKYK